MDSEDTCLIFSVNMFQSLIAQIEKTHALLFRPQYLKEARISLRETPGWSVGSSARYGGARPLKDFKTLR